MKLFSFSSALAITGLAALTVVSCRKHKMNGMEMQEINIAYPAAYVVNGESSTLSVIRLSDNTVTETIELMSTRQSNMSGMFPHHVYHHANAQMHRLAVAVPGMDLSAGHTGAVTGMKGSVLILDALKGAVVNEIELPAMNHNAVFSPDGLEIWTSQMEENGKVLVFDAVHFALKNTIPVGKEPAEITFSLDGSRAYVANGGSDNVSVIDPTSKSVIATVPVDHNPVAAWVGYDGKMYVDNEEGKTVSVIDVATNSVVQTIDLGFMPGSVGHNLFKNELWISDPDGARVHYWSWHPASSSWMKAGSFPAGAGAHAIAFSNDGATAYVTNQFSESVSVINVSTHQKVKDIQVGKKPNGIVIKY